MRKHFTFFSLIFLFVLVMSFGSIPVFAAETNLAINETTNENVNEITNEVTNEITNEVANEAANESDLSEIPIETITLDESLVCEQIIHADISWKTENDKGKWIEELGIANDTNSLILIINNLDKNDEEALPGTEKNSAKEFRKQKAEDERKYGKSRLFYFSKSTEAEWIELLSVDCYISGGGVLEKEALYGAYTPVSTFGMFENPGSLLPYKKLESSDYWTMDPKHESYGSIYCQENRYINEPLSVNLEGLKSYSYYGMILHPEEVYGSCPPLIINCQQTDSNNDLLGGIQMPLKKLRMMIQSIENNTRFIIAESMEDLADM